MTKRYPDLPKGQDCNNQERLRKRIDMIRRIWEDGMTGTQISQIMCSQPDVDLHMTRNAVISMFQRHAAKLDPIKLNPSNRRHKAGMRYKPRTGPNKPRKVSTAPPRPKAPPKPKPDYNLEVLEENKPAEKQANPYAHLMKDNAKDTGIRLLDLEPHHCRYPYGLNDFTFCGRHKAPDSPYCPEHRARCETKPEPFSPSRQRSFTAWVTR